jgi:predicted nucleotidyltransferase
METRKPHAVVDRFAAACQADGRVAAAFVGGSRAAGTADEHADVDLYLILRDDTYDGFFADRHSFMAGLGDAVFLEDFNGFGFDMLLFIWFIRNFGDRGSDYGNTRQE